MGMQLGGEKGKIHVTHINIRQSIFLLLLKLIFLDVMTAILVSMYYFLISNRLTSEVLVDTIQLSNLLFLFVVIFLKIVLAIYVVLLWINEYYEIWPTHLMHKSGLFLSKAEKHPFAQMRSVKIEQGFFGKIFGYGTICLYNWYLKTYTSLYLIHNPVKYFHIIESLIPKSEKEKEIFLDEPEPEEP